MVKDDPFGLSADTGRTRVRPAAGAPRRSSSAPAGPVPRPSRSSGNPLVNAFSSLLEFAPELEDAVSPGDPEALRARLHDELTAARDLGVASGVPMARADGAAWAVAALLDDLALNTPWGGASAWPRQPLVVALSGDVDAGAQFFVRLDELERNPNRDPQLLELYYFCLALGFRGKYRVPGRAGDRSLQAVRASAARFLRGGEAEAAALSPNWQGVVAEDAPRRFALPIWVLAVAALVLAAAIYALLSIRLADQADRLTGLVRALPPPERAEIYRPARGETKVAVPTVSPAGTVDFALLPLFQAAAPRGLLPALTGRETVSVATLVLQWADPEMFQSARPTLTDGFEPLIDAIGQVIAANLDVTGKVTVVGHTDSVPLQTNNPLSSNQRLSEARAQTIAKLLIAQGVPPDRISAEGRAATQPVAPNDTKQGRALNRRVEILIEKKL